MAIDHENGLVHEADGKPRCWWCAGDELYRHYHDTEWGQRVRDDRTLFEKICLEGFQSGLSWLTILRKRENFRAAFANFEIEKVAAFTDADIDRCLQDAGIVRHRVPFGRSGRPCCCRDRSTESPRRSRVRSRGAKRRSRERDAARIESR